MRGVVGKGTDSSMLGSFLNSSQFSPSDWTTLLMLSTFFVSLLSWGSRVNSLKFTISTLIFTDFHEGVLVPAQSFHSFFFFFSSGK